jgi:hypothetical protein
MTPEAARPLHPGCAPRGRALRPATVAVAALIAAAATRDASAQLYAHRTLVPVPLDDTTRSIGFLPGIDYFADIQRSTGSAGDDRAWGIRLAATGEVWRTSRATSFLISAADEVAANAAPKDGGFNPRGISWELGAAVVHRFAAFDWQVGFVHVCRHEIDNSDHPELPTPPDYVPTKRTMSVNGPRSSLILRPAGLGSVLGRRIRVRGVIAGESYHHKWDGRRAPDTTAAMGADSWIQARGAASGAVRVEAEVWRRSTLFVRGSGIGVFFRSAPGYPISAPVRSNQRVEAGWRAPGGGAALELYVASERLFDDVMTPTPRPSRMTGVGLRLSELNHF